MSGQNWLSRADKKSESKEIFMKPRESFKKIVARGDKKSLEISENKKIISMNPRESFKKSVARDANRAIETSRRFLRILGICQPDNPGKFYWRLTLAKISVLACYFGLGMCVIPVGLCIATEMPDPIGKIKLIGPWSFCVMIALKYRFLRSHRRDIGRCLRHIELDWLSTKNSLGWAIMRERARYGKLVTTICAGFTYSGGIFFATLPFVVGNFSTDADDPNVTITRSLSLPSTFVFFVATDTPAYEIIYAIQVAASFMMHSITIASYSLAVVIVMHACGQLEILMGMLDELVDGNAESVDCQSAHCGIANIVRHHVRALGFVSSAEKMLREICLVELGGCTLNLCLLGYFILLEWASENKDAIALMTWTTLFFSFMFNIFSFCYIGELLTGECRKVGERTYMIDWYRLPGKQSLGLGLIIAMARSPVTLTAGGATQLSFVCFASVVKTSMGYLNMLRTVMV